MDEAKDEIDNSPGGAGNIDLGADNNIDGGQFPTFYFFFFKNARNFKKNKLSQHWVGQIWPFFILSFSHF